MRKNKRDRQGRLLERNNNMDLFVVQIIPELVKLYQVESYNGGKMFKIYYGVGGMIDYYPKSGRIKKPSNWVDEIVPPNELKAWINNQLIKYFEHPVNPKH